MSLQVRSRVTLRAFAVIASRRVQRRCLPTAAAFIASALLSFGVTHLQAGSVRDFAGSEGGDAPRETAAAPRLAQAPSGQKRAAGEPTAQPVTDLKALEKRLVETKAVGVFAKLSLKRNADQLTDALRDYHAGKNEPTLGQLRERYDVLVQEVVFMVQTKDPELARDVAAAREPLWEQLANSDNFATT